jgi:hypothetical protein
MRVLKPIVAEVSPNLYTAAQRANMTPAEQNNIEQMSWAVKKNRELNRMGTEDARDEYNRLDPDVQEGENNRVKKRIKREERLDTQVVKAGDGLLKIWGAYTHT